MKKFISRTLVAFGMTMLLLSSGSMIHSELVAPAAPAPGLFCQFHPGCPPRPLLKCPLDLLGDKCGFWNDPLNPGQLVCRCGQ
jgi:hypothetical protein